MTNSQSVRVTAMHVFTITHATPMGYTTICDCGWSSGAVSLYGRALDAGAAHAEQQPDANRVLVALTLFVADNHRWSTRPCSTCAAITRLAGAPFGCDAFRLLPREHQNTAHGGN